MIIVRLEHSVIRFNDATAGFGFSIVKKLPISTIYCNNGIEQESTHQIKTTKENDFEILLTK